MVKETNDTKKIVVLFGSAINCCEMLCGALRVLYECDEFPPHEMEAQPFSLISENENICRPSYRSRESGPILLKSDPVMTRVFKLAHPGGPLTTNKAAALAKFLERKLQDPNGLSFIDPGILDRAVENARHAVFASTSNLGRSIRHVTSFGDPEESFEEENTEISKPKKQKEKKNKKSKKQKAIWG
ncbi:uncharacterized protein LOC120002207 [Tripterygium wilfordii]|uniref:uncharacterized protein LOC120002207 n=1 Tax=Tripterygium wilfordii TaxID=458696 RepID=UPI0018F7EE7A|nr:uncharacterized protein LOC120002207 [Tripterygium wilfordii]